MKIINLKNVLCLSPHPDDVEYGMLGTMIKYKDTNFDVLVLSQGGDFDTSSDLDRHNETLKTLDGIKNVNCKFSNVKFIKEKQEDEWINFIETKYDINSYDCIFTPPNFESHFEHRFVSNFSNALVRVSKCGIVSYRTPSTLDTWIPNLFVNLSEDVWESKINRLKSFSSQTNKSYFEDSSIESFHSNYQCSKRGLDKVESFKIERCYN